MDEVESNVQIRQYLAITVIGTKVTHHVNTKGQTHQRILGMITRQHTPLNAILFLFLAFAIGGIKVVESLHYAVHTVQCQMQLVNYCSVMNTSGHKYWCI